jgi:acetyl esterase/lipase
MGESGLGRVPFEKLNLLSGSPALRLEPPYGGRTNSGAGGVGIEYSFEVTMKRPAVLTALAWVALAQGSPSRGVALGQDQKPAAAGVKVLKDVSYGPNERNVMDLYLPEKGTTPRALILCIHGGGWAGGDKARYQWLGEALARKGFAAASVTYRFAPKFRSPAPMDDVQRAVRWLRKNAGPYGIDPERFGAIGGSAGGHLASYLALADTRDNSDADLAPFSSRVQCAVDCYGPVDLEAMMKSASAPIVEAFLGLPLQGNEEAYRKASPAFLVKANPPPFLIVHGTKDVGTSRGQVPMEQSVGFHEKLKQAGGEATLLKLEGGPHGFSHRGAGDPYAQQTLAAAVEFFARHLGKKP